MRIYRELESALKDLKACYIFGESEKDNLEKNILFLKNYNKKIHLDVSPLSKMLSKVNLKIRVRLYGS